MVERGLWLQLEGKTMTREAEKEWREVQAERRIHARLVGEWRWTVSRAGPASVLEYRAVAEALAWSQVPAVQLRAAQLMTRS